MLSRAGFVFLVLSVSLIVADSARAGFLVSGDIAFTAVNTDNPDQFTWIPLVNVSPGTALHFTDRGWRAGGAFIANSERTLTWTATSSVWAGTPVTITGLGTSSSSSSSATHGEVNDVALSLFGGDSLIAFQGTIISPRVVAGIHMNYDPDTFDPLTRWDTDAVSTATSALPEELTNGLTAISLFPGVTELDNARYALDSPRIGTRDELLRAINDPDNWEFHDSVRWDVTEGAAFNVLTAAVPEPSSMQLAIILGFALATHAVATGWRKQNRHDRSDRRRSSVTADK